ncbi:MAG: VIT and vWA domain-containing protein, partial [Deltaproteobacteria bacterium]
MNRNSLVAFTVFFTLLAAPSPARGDSGILIPRDKAQPDPAILSLEEMEITIRIDSGDARVIVKQIFANHTGRIEEGNYIFALPTRATVSDFAVWDGPTRIPAVVLERKRAEDIYAQLKQQAIDPGLLQMGERGPEEASRSSVFSARIVPIPPFGTKRLELEYHEAIPVENLKSYFAIPLRPDAYQAQQARHFKINFEFHSAHAISNFQAAAKAYPLKLDEDKPHDVRGHFEGENVSLIEDFVTTYNLASSDADSLRLLTYRNPDSGQPSPTETAPVRSQNEPGFVEAEALLGYGNNQASGEGGPTAGEPKTLVILFDTSLSMQWEKLERSYRALETLLRTLRPTDRFNLLLFNTQTKAFQPSPVAAEPGSIQQALDFVRASRLRGGTDLQGALKTALDQCSAASVTNTYLVLLSDGG